MSFYNLSEEEQLQLEKAGIDWDLYTCLEYNSQEGFNVLDITNVLAVYEGENDEESWRWIFKLVSNEFVIMQGWCDYTGWDCQSGANSKIFNSLDELTLDTDIVSDSDVMKYLIEQLTSNKKLTWTEETNIKLNVNKLSDELKVFC